MRALVAAGGVQTARGRVVSVTVSIGAAVAADALSLTDLMVDADHCLYQAKAGGRNRVARSR